MLAGGRVAARDVKVGHVAGASAEVLAGLAPGDEVVVFPPDGLAAENRAKRRN